MLMQFIDGHALVLHGLFALAGLVIYAFASNAWRQRRHPSAAIAWIVSLALIPYIALPLYLLIGNRKVVHSGTRHLRGQDLSALPRSDTAGARLCQLGAALGLPVARSYAALRLDEDGAAALANARAVMNGATTRLDICTFLLGRDVVGLALCALMIERARAGVRVRLLLDGVGLYLGGRPNLAPLMDAGIEVCLFVPPWSSPLPGRTNLRNHRKMIIADGTTLWTGGRNLAAEYFTGGWGPTRNKPAWTDLSFSLQGDLVSVALAQFERDWAFARNQPAPAWSAPLPNAVDGAHAQLIPSGPDQAEDTLYALLVSSCFTARRRILAITPYYIPDATLQMAMTLAALRGVQIDLIVPAHSNHRLADVARQAALRELAHAGARIWLAPQMTHAKAIIFDDDIAITGSANLDERSLFLNFEMSIAFFEADHVALFAQWVEGQRALAMASSPTQPGFARAVLEGLVRWLAFQI